MRRIRASSKRARSSRADFSSPGARSRVVTGHDIDFNMNSGLPLGKGFRPVFIVITMSNTASPESLARLDAQHHLHPFTNHEDMHATGTHVIVRGEGVYVWDAHGQK